MATTDTAETIARDLLADCGRQVAMDFLIDELIDTDDEQRAANISLLIDAVERAAAH